MDRLKTTYINRTLAIFILAVLLIAGLFFVLLFGAVLTSPGYGQTVLSPWQVRSTIQTVEWAKCEWSGVNVEGKLADCNGIEYYRFRLADGTITEPYLAWKAGPNFTKDPLKWRQIPLSQH